MSDSNAPPGGFDPFAITRPDKALMWYYLIVSLPGLLVPLLPLFFKYETLRYRFDEEGVSIRGNSTRPPDAPVPSSSMPRSRGGGICKWETEHPSAIVAAVAKKG